MTKFHISIDKIKLLLQMIAAELDTADRKPEYYITYLPYWMDCTGYKLCVLPLNRPRR